MNQKSKLKRKKTFAAGALIAGAFVGMSLHAGATPITVQNAKFTNPGPGSVPADWTITGTTTLASIENGNYWVHANSSTGPDYLNFSTNYNGGPITASQTTSYDAQLGNTFTLTVALGDSGFDPSVQTRPDPVDAIALTINGHIVAYDQNPPTFTGTRDFVDLTATYTLTADEIAADPDLLNGAVGIELLTPTTTAQYDYANVRLVVSTPEPSTLAMLCGALLSLFGLLRLRRRVS